MTGSSAPERPTSRTRTRSRSGCRSKSPRTMAPVKFSSASKRSIGRASCQVSAAGEQSFAHPGRWEAGLVLPPDFLRFSTLLPQVRLDFGAVAQVEADHRVDVRQTQCGEIRLN